MTIRTTARTADMPLTFDGLPIAATLPAGQYEFRYAADGRVLVVATTMDTASQPTRAALEAANVEGLKRILAGSGAQP